MPGSPKKRARREQELGGVEPGVDHTPKKHTNKPHIPTDDTRGAVYALASFGIKPEEIAKYIGISRDKLYKHYGQELSNGRTETTVQIARALYKQALAGNTQAAIFWLRTQGRWAEEPQEVRHAGPDGGPIQSENVTIDTKSLTSDQLEALLRAKGEPKEAGSGDITVDSGSDDAES